MIISMSQRERAPERSKCKAINISGLFETHRNYHTGPVSRLNIILLFLSGCEADRISYRPQSKPDILAVAKQAGYLTGREAGRISYRSQNKPDILLAAKQAGY